MFKTLHHTLRKIALGVALSATAVSFSTASFAAGETVKIGWTAWSDAEAVTNIAKQILEKRLGYKVELLMTDIALQYNGLTKGSIDLMLMSWLPNTHKAYWDKVSGQVDDLGILYDNARLGWVVPAYVPESEVKTIDDLKKPEVAAKFKKQIQGIDAGAGLTRTSEATIKTYGLDYKLLTASDAAMVAAVDRATKRNEWIIATTWTPHWMFAQYKLRYLDDPKQTLGGAEAIHALSRKGFDKDLPKVAAFIRNFKIPLADLEGVMLKAKDSTYEKEATAYIAAHPDLVEKWIKDSK